MIKSKIKKGLNRVLSSAGLKIVTDYEYFLVDQNKALEGEIDELLFSLFDLLSKFSNETTFIQIGANDGLRNDSFRDYLVKFNLSGIMIEPQKAAFSRLKELYAENSKIALENVAISTGSESLDLFCFDKEFEDGNQLDVFTSFDEKHLLTWKKKLHLKANINKITIPCSSVKELTTKHALKKVDVLVIDTEGYDFEIIKTVDFNDIRPLIIQYESMNLSRQDRNSALNLLAENGYHLMPGYRDTFAIHKDIFKCFQPA